MKKACKGFFLWILFLLLPLHAGAFVPEPSLFVELMLESLEGKGKMSMEVLRILPSVEGKVTGVEEKFLFNIPHVFRSESRDGHSFWLADAEDGFLLVQGAYRFQTSKPKLEDYFYGPLLIREKGALLRFLQRRGVDTTRTGLDRRGGKICFRLGNAGGSRLLVDKESFYPLFLVLEERIPGFKRRVEVRYNDWQKRDGFVFPNEIDMFDEDGVLLQQIRAGQVTGGAFSDSLMDFDGLRKRFPLSGGDAYIPTVEPDPSDPMQEIEKRLDRFRRRYEGL